MFKAEELMLRCLWGAMAQWSEHLQLRQEALFLVFSSNCLTNVDEMKDLYCKVHVVL